MEKKTQWNFKNVPDDVYKLIIELQAKLAIAKGRKVSIEQVCYSLIRRSVGLTEPEKKD